MGQRADLRDFRAASRSARTRAASGIRRTCRCRRGRRRSSPHRRTCRRRTPAPSSSRIFAISSGIIAATISFVTLRPSSSTPLGERIHCHTCEREISAVAASSIRLKIGTAPCPASHAPMYWIATLMLSRRPFSVIGFSGSNWRRSAAVDAHVVALLRRDLVRRRHQPVERLLRDRHEARMRDPGAVVAVRRLALLVGLHLGERLGVRRFVVLDRNLRRHAAHRVDVAAMARLDQQLRVALHEVRRHRDQRAVGEAEILVAAELLDAREDVVPAAAVEPGRVLAQLVEDLVHLEGGEHRLDQHRRLDRSRRDAELVLRHDEDVVPQPRLEVALELRQVEVRAAAARDAAPSRCGRSTARSRRCRRRSAAPSISTCFSGRCQPRGRTNSTAVLSFSWYALPSGDVKSIRRRIASRRLMWPWRLLSQRGVFASSKSAMNTLAPELSALTIILRSTGPGDLDAAVGDVGGIRRARPVRLADRARLGQEIGQLAGVELRLPLRAAREQLRRGGRRTRAAARPRTPPPPASGSRAYSGVMRPVISMPGP